MAEEGQIKEKMALERGKLLAILESLSGEEPDQRRPPARD